MIAMAGEIVLRDVVLIAAGMAALATIVKYAVVAPIRAFRRVERYAERLNDTMTTVEAQFKPNGGSSMKDAVTRIESQITTIVARMDAHDERLKLLEQIDAKQSRVEEIVASLPPPPPKERS